MNQEIKKYVDSGDRISLAYIFANSLDADPTFEEYQEEYDYCKSKGILEQHQEITPFSNNPQDWTEAYWARLKTDLKKNFSDERMMHMKKVAQIFLRDQVERLRKERAATAATTQTPSTPAASNKPVITTHVSDKVGAKAQQEQKRVDDLKKQHAAEKACKDAEQKAKAQQQLQSQTQQNGDKTGGGLPNFPIGVVLLIVAIIVVLLLILK